MAFLVRDLELIQTASFVHPFGLRSKRGTLDLTGYSARSIWRSSLASPAVVEQLSTATGEIVIDAEARSLTLSLPDNRRDLVILSPHSRLVYDVFVTAPSGRTYPLLKGQILIQKSVTR
jgi:hypothetical protein